MEDFELVNQLHAIGISDERIAKQCNVSRQFICNVRNGKKKAGAELHAKLQELHDAANKRGLLDTYTPPVQKTVPLFPYTTRKTSATICRGRPILTHSHDTIIF